MLTNIITRTLSRNRKFYDETLTERFKPTHNHPVVFNPHFKEFEEHIAHELEHRRGDNNYQEEPARSLLKKCYMHASKHNKYQI